MDKNLLVRKCLVVGIILLFISVAIVPSINFTVVKASNDNDFAEVTTQACGIKGYRDATVKLTGQQYQNLEEYLIEFRSRLNQTTTREEAVPIFKEAVVELNKYGLLPKGISVERAQHLVTFGSRIKHTPTIVKKLNQSSINYDCLFTAILYQTWEKNIWIRLAEWAAQFAPNPYTPSLLTIIFFLIWAFKPFHFNNEVDVLGDQNAQAFFSIGLGGIKSGPYNISKVLGFTGLRIILNGSAYFFYLGFALDIQEKS
jgi:hypothetical protein